MGGFVVCASCGARIKAERDRCLRCGEILETAEMVAARQALPKRQVFAIVAVLLLALLGTAVVWWETRSSPLADAARPVSLKLASAARPTPVAPRGWPADATPARQRESPARKERPPAAGERTASELQSAKAGYEQTLKTRPDDPVALNSLGLVLEGLGDKSLALARYSLAARLAPTEWSYRFNLAHVEGELQQWPQAAADYRLALASSPDDAATRYNLALALHMNGDDPAAIPEYRKAIEIAPGEPDLHMSLGISLEKVGRVDEAVREYGAYLGLAPSAPDAAQVKAHADAIAAGDRQTRVSPSS